MPDQDELWQIIHECYVKRSELRRAGKENTKEFSEIEEKEQKAWKELRSIPDYVGPVRF